MANIKGILFDKDGTLIDFQKTWFAIGDLMALQAAGGDRARADELMTEAGYDFQAHCFKADLVFAAGTNADIVALWYPEASSDERQAMVTGFDVFTAEQGAAQSVALPGSRTPSPACIAPASASAWPPTIRPAARKRRCWRWASRRCSTPPMATTRSPIPKPAPDAIRAFCDLTGLKPSEIAMVGDNRHDLEMARAGGAGLAVGVLCGTGTRETLLPLADVILNSVADLPAYLTDRA